MGHSYGGVVIVGSGNDPKSERLWSMSRLSHRTQGSPSRPVAKLPGRSLPQFSPPQMAFCSSIARNLRFVRQRMSNLTRSIQGGSQVPWGSRLVQVRSVSRLGGRVMGSEAVTLGLPTTR